MLDREQYLLTKLAEEAAEVAQIALKAQQFGLSEMRSGQPFTNAQRIHQELNDLFTVILLLNDECHLNYMPDEKSSAEKKQKMDKYAAISRKLKKIK